MVTTRTVCPGCGADVVVKPNGIMDKHRATARTSTPILDCPWAGKPAPSVETRGPLAQLELLEREP